MSFIKSVAKDWLPPVVMRAIRQYRGENIRFEGEFASWEDAAARCTGYDSEHILSKVLDATLKVKSGEAAFERDSILFDQIEYSWPITAGLMWAAACCSGRLDVLDFGGALGSSYFQNKKLLDALSGVHWNIVEQPHYVQAGRTHVQDARLKFYESIEQCLKFHNPNIILLSSVLQYLPDPYVILKEISKCTAFALIVDRTPFADHPKDMLVTQQVPLKIYSANYPMWILSWDKFIKQMESGWDMISTTDNIEGQVKTNFGFNFGFQGMLFKSKI